MVRLAMLLLVGCASSTANSPATSATGATATARAASAPSACPTTPATFVEFDAPNLIHMDRSFAGWIGDDIAVLAVAGITLNEPTFFEGAIWAASSESWSAIPRPPFELPRGPSITFHARFVDERIVLLWEGLAGSERLSGGGVYDPRARAWTQIAAHDAPSPIAYLTGPYREATIGPRWIWWPTEMNQPHPDMRGYVLDVRAARWTRMNAEGAPTAAALFYLRALPDGRVLVPDASHDIAGIFDPIANRWESVPFPRVAGDHNSVDVAPDGASAVVLSWTSAGSSAWIADLRARTVAPIASVPGTGPINAALVHYDGEHVFYVASTELHRFTRSSNAWSSAQLAFEMPVPSGAVLREVCGGRLLLTLDRYHLFEPRTSTWHPVPWREDVPVVGRHMLFGSDRIAVIGNSYETFEPVSCPPGAPCLPPQREEVRETRSYIVPIE